MPWVQRMITAAALVAFTGSFAFSADRLPENQLERLMETASQTPDRPDHDYATNSLQALLRQRQDLNLSKEQTEKIKTIMDQYDRIRRDREMAYKRSEMDALKLIHDRHSSLFSIENAVQKADQDHSKLRMAGIKALREARDVLRPEQYSRWRQDHAGRKSLKARLNRSEASSTTAKRARQGVSLRTDPGYRASWAEGVHHASIKNVDAGGRGGRNAGPAVDALRVGGR